MNPCPAGLPATPDLDALGRAARICRAANGHATYTTGDVAKLFDVSARTATHWIDRGLLRGYTIPGSNDRRVTRSEVARFATERGIPLDEIAAEAEAPASVLLVGVSPGDAAEIRAGLAGIGVMFVVEARSPVEAGLRAAAILPRAVVIDASVGRIEAGQVAQALLGGPGRPAVIGWGVGAGPGSEEASRTVERVVRRVGEIVTEARP
jgi:excisionase family DNA binding protein